jgi:hypothetical protein
MVLEDTEPIREDSEGEANESEEEEEELSDNEDLDELRDWDCEFTDGSCRHYSQESCEEEARHRIRMKAAREESEMLKSIVEEQDRVLLEMHHRTMQIKRATEERRVELAALKRAREAREEREASEAEENGSNEDGRVWAPQD